jgi:hypothetical protein
MELGRLQGARHGLKEQVLRNEQLQLRLAKLLRERFGASSEKLRGAIEQLALILGDLEEQAAQTAPPEPDEPAAPSDKEPRRKPACKPPPETPPRDVVEHAAPCACPKCGGSLRPLGEDVTEVLDYVPGAFGVTRHVRPKLSCRACEGITQAPAQSLPIHRGMAGPGLLAHATRDPPPRPHGLGLIEWLEVGRRMWRKGKAYQNPAPLYHAGRAVIAPYTATCSAGPSNRNKVHRSPCRIKQHGLVSNIELRRSSVSTCSGR